MPTLRILAFCDRRLHPNQTAALMEANRHADPGIYAADGGSQRRAGRFSGCSRQHWLTSPAISRRLGRLVGIIPRVSP